LPSPPIRGILCRTGTTASGLFPALKTNDESDSRLCGFLWRQLVRQGSRKPQRREFLFLGVKTMKEYVCPHCNTILDYDSNWCHYECPSCELTYDDDEVEGMETIHVPDWQQAAIDMNYYLSEMSSLFQNSAARLSVIETLVNKALESVAVNIAGVEVKDYQPCKMVIYDLKP
jgi:transposase-like protein